MMVDCADILNTCVLALAGSLGAIIAAGAAYLKADKAERNGIVLRRK